MRLRAALYKAARVLGDVQAIRRGRIAHRVARSYLQRGASSIIRRLIK